MYFLTDHFASLHFSLLQFSSYCCNKITQPKLNEATEDKHLINKHKYFSAQVCFCRVIYNEGFRFKKTTIILRGDSSCDKLWIDTDKLWQDGCNNGEGERYFKGAVKWFFLKVIFSTLVIFPPNKVT